MDDGYPGNSGLPVRRDIYDRPSRPIRERSRWRPPRLQTAGGAPSPLEPWLTHRRREGRRLRGGGPPRPSEGDLMHQHLHRIGDRVDRLLNALWEARGTDLMLTAGLPPMIRVDGTLAPVAGAVRADRRRHRRPARRGAHRRAGRRVGHPARVRLLLLLARARPDPRQRVHPARADRGRAADDPARDPDPRRPRAAAGAARPVAAAPGADPDDRPDRARASRPRSRRWST